MFNFSQVLVKSLVTFCKEICLRNLNTVDTFRYTVVQYLKGRTSFSDNNCIAEQFEKVYVRLIVNITNLIFTLIVLSKTYITDR